MELLKYNLCYNPRNLSKSLPECSSNSKCTTLLFNIFFSFNIKIYRLIFYLGFIDTSASNLTVFSVVRYDDGLSSINGTL